MKRLISIFIVGTAIIISAKYFSKPFINHDTILGRISNVLNTNNLVKLKCVGLAKSSINISWSSEMNNSEKIIQEGEKVGKVGHEYGPNNFLVSINNMPGISFSHFKTNNWHAHNYSFRIIAIQDSISICFSAIGPDPQEYTKKIAVKNSYL